MKKLFENAHISLAFVALLTLAAAHASEYLFGWAPCELCLKQRIPYWVAVGVGLIGLLLRHKNNHKLKITAISCISLCFAATCAIAIYQVGVEEGIFHSGCSAEAGDVNSLESMRAAIEGAPLVSCDQPVAVILGLSLAKWHVIYSGMLTLFSLWLVRKKPSPSGRGLGEGHP